MDRTVLELPVEWPFVGVQRPLFLEHLHTINTRRIRLLGSRRVQVNWVGADNDELAGRVFSETFDLTRKTGQERFKDFLQALSLACGRTIVDLDVCVGRAIEVMAMERPLGHSSRIEILHHLPR